MHKGIRRTISSLIFVAAGCTALAGCEFMVGTEERIARAEQALAQGDSGAAIVDLKNVLQEEAGNARARLLLARAELLRGDVDAAASGLEKVNAAEVPAEDYELLKWRVAYARRQYDEIVRSLAAPRAGLGDGERLLILGLAQAGAGRASEAREALAKAVAARPDDGEAIAALALSTASTGDAAAARDMLVEAVRRLPDDERVQRALGDLEFRSGRLPEAEAAYRRAVDLGNARSRPTEYLSSAGGLADVLLAQSKLEAAGVLATQLAKSAPGAGVTVLLAARLAAAKRDYGVALENLQKLLNANPESAQLRTMVAGIQLEQGALEQATANLRRVLASHPDAEPARRLLAQVQLAQGRPKDADETLARGGAAGADVALMRARAALASGDTKRALATLDELAAQGVPTEEARLDLAAAYIQAGRGDRAIEILDAAPGTPDAGSRREQLRLIALAGQDRPAAIRALSEYADGNAGDPRAVTFASLTLAALGEFDAARARLGKLAAAAPKDADVRINLARVEARAGRLDAAEAALREATQLRPDAPTYVGLAQLAAARGREEEAIRLLEQARGADAKATQPRLLLARAYLAKGQADAAGKVAGELLAIEPNNPQPHLLAATLALRTKDTQRALREANEAVRLAPESPLVVLAKGEIHEQLGQRDEARAAYRRAATLAPTSAAPAAALARLELAAGNAEAALAAARRVQQDPATRPTGLQLEGDVLMRLGRPAEAARAYEELQKARPSAAGAMALYRARLSAKTAAPEQTLRDWLAAHPADGAVRLALAEHWQRSGDRARAIAEYESAVKAKADDAIALNNLAWLYHEVSDARALATAQRAHQLAPRVPAIADTLGVILVATGRVDEGIAVLREAAKGAPGFADIQFHLAEALARKGSKAEAQQVLDGILRETKTPAEVRTKAEALAKTLR